MAVRPRRHLPFAPSSGARLFDGAAPPAEFALTGSVATTKGVLITHYERR